MKTGTSIALAGIGGALIPTAGTLLTHSPWVLIVTIPLSGAWGWYMAYLTVDKHRRRFGHYPYWSKWEYGGLGSQKRTCQICGWEEHKG